MNTIQLIHTNDTFSTSEYDTKCRKHAKDKYWQLSELGYKLGLSFSSHLSLGNKMIGLDGLNRKLLVFDNNNVENRHCMIHLDEVKVISVRKDYKGIEPGELNRKGFEEFLDAILLYFQYKDERHTITLPFYERGKNSFCDLAVLERNARNWQMILSKMINPITK